MLVSILPSRNTEHGTRSTLYALRSTVFLLAWWLVPVALIFAVGLYKEAYLKFLLVCSPAFCLLFARGIVTAWRTASNVVPFKELEKAPARRPVLEALVILLLIFVAMFTVQSLSNLYFDPAYARDDYRGIAQRIQKNARAGDAILLNAPNQWETFTYYHRDDSNVFPLARVRPVTAESARKRVDLNHGALQTAVRAVLGRI